MIPYNYNYHVGYALKESSFVQEATVLYYEKQNVILVPDDGTIYIAIFINGINDNSLDAAIAFANNKIKDQIDELIKKHYG